MLLDLPIFPWLMTLDLCCLLSKLSKNYSSLYTPQYFYDFSILVPIFNNIGYLKNIDFLAQYGEKVVLCTTSQESPEFMEALFSIAKKHNFRVKIADVVSYKNPWSIYKKSLIAHDISLKQGLMEVNSKYVILIDADTIINGKPEHICGIMEYRNYDIASVKVIPKQRKTCMEKLQCIEYELAMRARKLYPWLTSGAGMVARREALVDIFNYHSLFFNGGDIEIGKIAEMLGYKIGHIPIEFLTEIPSTFRSWVRQRTSWMCGCFRHSIINIDKNLHRVYHTFYFSICIYFLLAFKLLEMIKHWHILPWIIFVYILLSIAAGWKQRTIWMFLFPLYALFQATFIAIIGIIRYFQFSGKYKTMGRFRIGYKEILKHRKRDGCSVRKMCLKIATTLTIAMSSILFLLK